MRALVVAALPLALAGCLAPGADPCDRANRAVNLGTLASNTLSGSYDACVGDLQAELGALRLEGSALRAESARLNSDAARLSGESASLTRRIAALNSEQAALIRRIEDDPGVSDADKRRILGEEKALREDIADVSDAGAAADPDLVDQIERRQRLLLRNLQAIYS